jgi:hypothetical protein
VTQVCAASKALFRFRLLWAAVVGVWFFVSGQQAARPTASSVTRYEFSEQHNNRDQTRVRALLVTLRSSRRETGIDEHLPFSAARLTAEPFAGADTPTAWFCESTIRSFTIDSPPGFQGCSDLSARRSRAPPIS